MKKMKRWLALVLAIALVSTNAIYQLGTHMSASESSQDTSVSEEQPQQEEQAADSQTQDTTEHTDSGQASVQEVTPDQSATATTQQAADVQQAADAQQTEAEQTDVAKTIAVKIQKSDVDGGTVKVVNADGSKSDVTYDGNNQYAKEVTEGESFGFEVTAKDGYQVEQVTDQNGTVIQPASVNGNVSTYNVTDIRSEKVFSVTYNKVETQTEEKKDEKTENKAEDATATEETEDQNDADTQVTSTAGETHEDTATEKWITVGKSVTLSSENYQYGNYSHEWSIDEDSQEIVSKSGWGSSITVTGLKEGTATVKDKVTWTTGVFWQQEHEDTITYTVHVLAKKSATGITITGANEVTQFKNINLTYTLTPTGAEGTVQWSSSNEDILTVDSSGKVTGLRRGQATVTANVYSGQSLLCSATKTIQVVEDTTVAGDSAIVYYLLDPTKDANSNDSGNWGPAYGTAKVNVTGATWTGGRNCFDNVDQRVVSWPNGTNVVTRDSTAWNQIFNKYKSSVEEQLGVPITEDDVVSITLRPAKISRNNSSTPDLHLDCNVDVNCKRVSIVHYYLLDKSSDPNSTEYVHQGSKSYINGNKTNPETVTGKSFPRTKTGTDGATYTFSGWYTDQELTQPATFPYTVNSNVNFYAKYVAGRQVVYNLDGGSFSDGSSLTEKHNEGENVVVKSEPTRKGYKFTGWTVEGLDGVSSINSGARFQMPNNNVTITANWKEQKIEDFITLTPKDVTEVYNGEAHEAGIATASAKKAEANLDGVKIEYQKADGTWTENPAEITATNVADSTTVKVRVTSENYVGKLEKSEKLTITKRSVTISVANDEKYYGTEDPEFASATMSGQVAGELADVDLRVIRTNASVNKVGTYKDVLTINSSKKELEKANTNYTFTIIPGTFEIKKNDQGALTVSAADVTQTYDGNAYGVAPRASIEGATITYKDANGNYTLTESPTRTDAGQTTVEFKASLEGYADAFGSATITINKRPVEIKAANASKTYGEVDPAFAAATMSGQVTGELTDIDLTVSRSDAGDDTLGTHEDVLSISQSKEALEEAYTNYTFTIKPADFTVNENKTALTVSAADVTKVYDGTSYGITAVASIEGATIKYKDKDGNYTLDASPVRKNVGETTVEFEASLYGYKTVTGKATIKITKRPVTITAANSWKYYGNDDPEFQDAIMENQVGNELDTVGLSVIRTNAQVNKVGTYKEVLTINQSKETLEEEYTNYTFAINPGDFEIKTNDQDVLKVGATNVSKTYDGQSLGVTATATLEGATIKYKDADGNYTLDESPTRTEYGKTTVEFKASLEGYKDAYGSATINIDKRPVEIKAANASKSYGEVDPAFASATMSGQVTGELTDVDLTVSRSDAGTEDGEKLGTHTDVLNISQTKAELEEAYTNYTFTIAPADFTINTNEDALTVSAEDVTKTYDGTSYGVTAVASIEGATIKYKDAEGNYTLDASPTKKNVGEKEVEFEASLYGYKTVTGKAKITITKRPAEITVANDEKYYGTEDPEFASATMSGQVAGELTDVDLRVIRTNASVNKVGTYKDVLTINSSKKELEKANTNYTFTIIPGTFEIKKNDQGALTVSAADVTQTYDGNAYGVAPRASIEGATITYKDANGNYTLTESPTRTDAGQTTVEFKASLEGYADAFGSATITINKRPVEIKAANASKTYGEVDPAFVAATMSGQVTGELIDVDLTVSRSDAGNNTLGTHEDVLSISQSKEALEEAYTNYTFTIKPADFTINENETALTVSAADVTKTYDGTSYGVTAVASIDGATIKYKDKDDKYTLDASPTKKNVGEKEVEFEASLYGYKTVTGKAKITITKRPVTITAANSWKYYGNADPTFDDAIMQNQVAGELTDVDLSVIRSNAQVNKVGTYEKVLTINSSKEVLEEAHTNYTFTINPGTFKIKTNDQNVLQVGAVNVKKTYDGQSLGVEAEATLEGAVIKYKDADGNYTLDESPTRTNVGTTTVEFKASLEGYADAFGSATITIEKRPVEIKAANASKSYGEADPAFASATMSGQVTGELTDVDLTVSRSDAGTEDGEKLGTHTDVLNISQTKAELEEAYTNYTFTIAPADFTINTNEDALTVSAEDVTKTYDGTSYGVTAVASIEGATIKYKDAEGNYTLDASPTKKNVGEKEVEFEASLYGYKTVTGKAKITITKRPAEITVANDEKYYGTEDPEFASATMSGQVAGELTDVDLRVIRTNASVNKVGTYKDVLTINSSKKELEKANTNYTFTIIPGTFEIKKNDQGALTVSAADVTQTYDGNAYGVAPRASIEGATITYKDANGNYTLTESPTRTDAGQTTVEFKASLEGYADAFGSATITINKRPVEIKAANASKTYGEVDPAFVAATMSGQVTGELIDVDLTVSRSDAGNNTLGTHEDVLSISQSKEALEEAYTNYTFTIKPADFTINENETALTVSAADVTKTYDGTSYGVTAVASIDGATIKYKDKDDKYTLDASPTKKNVGEKEVEFEASLYGYKTVTGKAKITITKRPVTITAANSWKYYGNADPTFDDAIMQNQVAGELTDVDLSVIRSNAQVNKVGTYEKVLTINSSKEVLEEAHTNYTFTINPGTFKIKTNDQNVLQVGAVNVKKTYDGQSLGVEAEATLEGAVIKYKDADGNYTLDESPTRTNVGTTTVEFKASLEGYADAFGSATITIEKRPVEIKAANASKSYGEADPAFASATMSGQVTGELTDVDLTVSRSDAGTEDGEKLGTHTDVLNISQTKAELEEAYTNYTFTIAPADFTINENETALTVSAADVTKTYDGTSYGVTAVANINGAIIKYKDADGNYTLDASPMKKNVGEKEVEFEASLYGYKTVTGKAKITITKRPAEITVANDEKYYGTEDPEFASATMSGQVAGELTDVDLRVIRTNASVNKVGTYKDVLTINSSKKELEKANTNYTFTIIPGTFEIKKNDQGALTVSAADVTQTYDGNAYGVAPRASIEGATITYKDANGNYTLTESPTRTDAGQTTVEFKASLEGYADAFGSATITINKRPVEIKAANASKTYGEVDPAFVAATMSGQVTGELIDVDLTVSRSDAGNNTLGTHEDVLSISQSKEALEEAYTNYTFTIKPADFTVNENETALTVSAADVTKTYDGTSYGVTAVASINGATIKYKDKDGKYTLDASPVRKECRRNNRRV